MAIKKVAIIGLGHFGSNLAISLTEEGIEVVAVDCNEEKVEVLRDKVAYPVCTDATDQRTLRSLGLTDMDAVVVAIGEHFEDSILVLAHLQEMGIKRIIARVINPVHERIVSLMSLTEVVLPEKDAAIRLAKRLAIAGLLSSMPISEDYSIFEVHVPKRLIGKTVAEVNLRASYRLNLVTLKRFVEKPGSMDKNERNVHVIGVPAADDVFKQGDILVLFGNENATRELLEH